MPENKENITEKLLKCYHCGEDCKTEDIKIEEKIFCCNGCKTVFEILDNNNMCDYYNYDDNPGINRKNDTVKNFDYLNDPELKNTLIDFTNGNLTSLSLIIPQMHCSSCIWILENLQKLNNGILTSEVNFLKKSIRIQYSEDKTSLKEVIELLSSLGYEPELNFEDKRKDNQEEENKKLYYRIGVAGFAFGNIMLLSFPEYLGIGAEDAEGVNWIFNYLNLILALPVLFYSASIYFKSAYQGLRKGIFNIDVPVTLGILTMLLTSTYQILSGTGAGYFDSLAALVFLLLTGRLFQNKTYDSLNFERRYKSYFPIAVHTKKDGSETTIPVSKIKIKDRLIIKNNEIIPADSVLIHGNGSIDYSFVTGESIPVYKEAGDLIYAGGRQTSGIIEVDVVKEVSQSYLTQLWNNKIFDKNYDSTLDSITNNVSKYFTFGILAIGISALIYWLNYDPSMALYAFASVLIIACPCALSLSTPFTFGNALRILGKNDFYIKNTGIIEKLSSINTIVFDKTGTITISGGNEIEFSGNVLSEEEKKMIRSIVNQSSHPLSVSINEYLKDYNVLETEEFNEIPGMGVSGIVNNHKIEIGSSAFIKNTSGHNNQNINTKIFLKIDEELKGFFGVKNVYRKGFKEVIENFKNKVNLAVLSGDSDNEESYLRKLLPERTKLLFNQNPFEKLNFIKSLQEKGNKVLMFGDGLNDAGAIKQSDVGISVTENVNNFSPASDAILKAEKFPKINKMLIFSRVSKKIVIISFIISFLYNVVGLSFAVTGQLSPVIAAILMPLSSISVVVFTTLAVNFSAKKLGL